MAVGYYLQSRIGFLLIAAAVAAAGLVISATEAGDLKLADTPQVDLLGPADYARLVRYQPLPEMDGST